jgi:hypothetical protein
VSLPSIRNLLLVFVTTGAIAGCSQPDGPTRYDVTGVVTYARKPVPVGFVTFIPNTDKGNKGPGGGADVKDGKYDTASGKGMVGGPHKIQVVGFDGIPVVIAGSKFEEGTPLFPRYEFEADLPSEAGKFDIDVPVTKKKS